MRDFIINIEPYSGCCQADIICNFEQGVRGLKLTDKEWFHCIGNGEYSCRLETRLISFVHSSKENTGICSPKKFAEWLRSKGEVVLDVTHLHNTMYCVALSDRFWNEYKDSLKEEEKEYGADGDTSY